MKALELKQELHNFINQGDEKFIKMFYEMAKAYMQQLQHDKLIAESEKDIQSENAPECLNFIDSQERMFYNRS